MVFIEKQKLDILWIKVLMLVSAIIAVMTIFMSKYKEDPTEPAALVTTGLVIAITAITYFLIFEVSAFTKVNDKGIHYKYRPWFWNFKLISWAEIERIEIKEINPLTDFGGWGVKYGFKKGLGIILSGNNALIITKKNGKQMTITTDRKHELQKAIENWHNIVLQNG